MATKLTPLRAQVLRALDLGHSGEMIEGKATLFHLTTRAPADVLDPCPGCGLAEYRNITRPTYWLIRYGFVYGAPPFCLTSRGRHALNRLNRLAP